MLGVTATRARGVLTMCSEGADRRRSSARRSSLFDRPVLEHIDPDRETFVDVRIESPHQVRAVGGPCGGVVVAAENQLCLLGEIFWCEEERQNVVCLPASRQVAFDYAVVYRPRLASWAVTSGAHKPARLGPERDAYNPRETS